MDIFADNGAFGISMVRMQDFKYKANNDRTLSMWGKKSGLPISVTTRHGEFVEAVDERGCVIAEGGDGNILWVPLSDKPVKLRFKKLPDPELSAAEIKKGRQSVTRRLVADSPYSLGIPDDLNGVISWMKKQLDVIPEPCRKNASFRFDTRTEYGDTYPEITISYEEQESDAEVIARIKIERERGRIAEAAEREKLRRLQEKYKCSV